MSNPFINYLNSLNSADANGEGALAESQVASPYFDKVFVRRPVSDYLKQLVLDRPCTVILTGHAGDGKTSLLVQLLKDLQCLPPGDTLKVNDTVTSPTGGMLFYVKDMSELTKERQAELLRQALDAPSQNASAVLVTNTGPLINTLRRIFADDPKEKQEQLITQVLEELDANDGQALNVSGQHCYILNVARIENVGFARPILERLIQNELWGPCLACIQNPQCPMFQNQQRCQASFSLIAEFCSDFYRYLSEYDNRLTIRQITAHISYALTGNLTCEQVSQLNKHALFNYHFANLLFGYVGFEPAPKATQIRAIGELQRLGLDTLSLDADYSLFVQQKYDSLPDTVAYTLNKADNMAAWLLRHHPESKVRPAHRKAIRRFYVLFSHRDEATRNRLLGQLYSPFYPLYLKAVGGKQLDITETKSLQSLVFKALYVMFVGMPSTHQDEIPLTVKRNGAVTQYAQLLLGTVPSTDLSVQVKKVSTSIDIGNGSFRLELRVKGLQPHIIRFPLLEHFWHVANGSVATSLSPSLSHGIDRLKAQLINSYSNTTFSEDKRFQLLLVTNMGVKKARLELADRRLYVE